MPYHLYSPVLIYLIPTASISAVGSSCLLQPVLTDCNSLFPTYLYHSVTSFWYSPDKPNRLFQSDTVSSEQFVRDNSLIQLWYHTCIRPEGATGLVTGLWRFCVCRSVHTSDMTPFWVTDSTLGDCGAEYLPGRGRNVARNVLPSRRCSPGEKSSNKIKWLHS